MYNEQIENLVKAALADGVLTEKEKQILFKKAESMGIDLDEFEMVLDARLLELQKVEKEKIEKSAPKSNKVGDIKKCPACGAIVQSYQGVCSECGYVFENVEVNYAAKELSNLLMKAKTEQEMTKIIDTFPVPIEKAALIAFATWLAPQSLDVQNPLSKSYQKKYDEVITKAQLTFSNDKDITSLVIQHKENKKNILRSTLKYNWMSFIKPLMKKWWFWVIVFYVILFICMGVGSYINDLKANKSSELIIEAVNKGELEEATALYIKYSGDNKDDLINEFSLIFRAYLEKENIIKAENIFNLSGIILDGYPITDVEKRKNELAKQLYNLYIKNGEYDKARIMIENADSNRYLWGGHIMDVVVSLCEKGEKTKAKKYLKKYVGNIDDSYDKLGLDSYPTKDGGTTSEGDQKYVTKLINDVIATY
jgi:tetratricopeptide (TPR) repeat protein